MLWAGNTTTNETGDLTQEETDMGQVEYYLLLCIDTMDHKGKNQGLCLQN